MRYSVGYSKCAIESAEPIFQNQNWLVPLCRPVYALLEVLVLPTFLHFCCTCTLIPTDARQGRKPPFGGCYWRSQVGRGNTREMGVRGSHFQSYTSEKNISAAMFTYV